MWCNVIEVAGDKMRGIIVSIQMNIVQHQILIYLFGLIYAISAITPHQWFFKPRFIVELTQTISVAWNNL